MQRQFNRLQTNDAEKNFSERIVGLRSREEFTKAQQELKRNATQITTTESNNNNTSSTTNTQLQPNKLIKLQPTSLLSFNDNDDEETNNNDNNEQLLDEPLLPLPKIKKDPSAINIVPDSREIEQIKSEWEKEQEKAKQECIDIPFLFGNSGSLVKCKLDQIKRGTTIGEFLDLAHQHLLTIVPGELASHSSDPLMFVKDDVIIPSVYCFQDLFMCDARAKSGTRLYQFDQGRPVRVCHRSWYEKSKMNHPQSRWEIFKPEQHSNLNNINNHKNAG
jgi:protein FAM50